MSVHREMTSKANMDMPKRSRQAKLDALLGYIQVNRKPMSVSRLQWWFVIILTRLFGQKVHIEGEEGQSLRLFPVIWRQKLYLLGSEHEFLQIDYTSQYTLRLTKAPVIAVGSGESVRQKETPGGVSSVHIVLSHLPSQKTDPILNYLKQLGSAGEIVLAYGGTAKNFEGILYPKKVFISDDKLRGAGYRQSYFGLMKSGRDYLKKEAIDAEWIFISDYDLVPLEKNYLDGLISIMKQHGAGFGGKLIRDVSLSNSFFLTNAIQDGILQRTPGLHGLERKPIYHCLGACLLFHRNCFDAILELADDLSDMYFELAIPTAANLKGFRVVSFDKHSDVLRHVRYRPVYSCSEAVQLAENGASFIHPIKEISEFIMIRSTSGSSR